MRFRHQYIGYFFYFCSMKYLVLTILTGLTSVSMTQLYDAPGATVIEKQLTVHNSTRVDPFFYMNQRDNKEVLEYIDIENDYTKRFFDKHKSLTTRFLDEFENRINPNDVAAPFEMNGLTFQWRNIKGKEYKELVKLENGKSKLFFDENIRAANKSYYALGDLALNENNKFLAFSEDIIGRRKYEIRIRNNATNELLKDVIKNTDGTIVWAFGAKKPTFFYLKKDEETLREFQVYMHVVGQDPAKDKLVFEEKDERFYVSIHPSSDKKYIIIQVGSTTTSESLLIDSKKTTDKPVVFLKRKPGHLYEVDHNDNGFYILSNINSPNKEMYATPTIPNSTDEFKPFFNLDENILLEGFLLFKKFIVVQSRNKGRIDLNVIDFSNNTIETVVFPDEVFETGFSSNDNYTANAFNYYYTSFNTPGRVYRYDVLTKKSEITFEKKLIDPGFNPSNYETSRVWVKSRDGVEIPVSLVYKKGIDLANAPVLQYGYGSYGYTIPCHFSAMRLSLLDRGFVFAIAHIRGGKFLGESWYQDGKLMSKKNTFYDFIDATKGLLAMHIGKPGHVYAQGGSAGGLLMGAIANMTPDLYAGIVAQVPFVDVVTTMLDESIPLTVGEYEEWGNPNEKDAYDYMLSYSPYDNVSKQKYPAMYITTGFHDSQVQYWEPLKWTAKLRRFNTSNNIILFECSMDAGHGGGSGVSTERLEEAKLFTFLCALEGINA